MELEQELMMTTDFDLNKVELLMQLMNRYGATTVKLGEIEITCGSIKNTVLVEDEKDKIKLAKPFWEDEDFYSAVPTYRQINEQ